MLNKKAIKPLFNKILTTAEKYETDFKVNGLVVYTAGTLKEYQKVLAKGATVREIEVGDVVQINPSRYAVKKYDDNSVRNDLGQNKVITYNFDIVEMEDKPYLLLYDTDIDYVITDFEEVKETPKPKLFVPEKKIIFN